MLARAKLNNMDVSVFKALTNSYIYHDEFILLNNASKEYDDMKGKIKKNINLNSKSNILI